MSVMQPNYALERSVGVATSQVVREMYSKDNSHFLDRHAIGSVNGRREEKLEVVSLRFE